MKEACGETHHDKCGKFCLKHKAATITKDGVRYKPVRQLRKIKGGKTRSKKVKPPQEENVISIGHEDEKSAVGAMLDYSPHGWISLRDLVDSRRILGSGR